MFHIDCVKEQPVNLEEAGKELFALIDAADAEAVRRLPNLKLLLRTRFGADGQTALIKCLEKYSTRPRDDIRRLFAVLLAAADTEAVNLTDAHALYTPLMWAIQWSFASTALLDQLMSRTDIDISRALSLLCSHYTRADVKVYFDQLVSRRPSIVDEPAKYGNTPLHKACRNRQIGAVLVRLLIAKGAEIESQNDHRETPLFEAVKLDHEECVRVLLSVGADVLAQV